MTLCSGPWECVAVTALSVAFVAFMVFLVPLMFASVLLSLQELKHSKSLEHSLRSCASFAKAVNQILDRPHESDCSNKSDFASLNRNPAQLARDQVPPTRRAMDAVQVPEEVPTGACAGPFHQSVKYVQAATTDQSPRDSFHSESVAPGEEGRHRASVDALAQ